MLASYDGKRAIENFTDGLKSCETESEENPSEWVGNESGCELQARGNHSFYELITTLLLSNLAFYNHSKIPYSTIIFQY